MSLINRLLSPAVPLALALCLFAGPGRAADTPTELPVEARQALSRAQAQLDQQQPAEAARIMQQYLDSAPTSPAEAYVMLGVAQSDAGNRAGAREAFQSGLKRFPEDPFLNLNCAVLLFEAEKYAEAAPLFEKAYDLQEAPRPELLYQAGSAWYLAGNYAASAKVMERLVSTASPLRTEWVQLAVHAFLEAGNLARAESMVLTLLGGAPGEAPYWELLAKVHLDRERFAKAAAALEVAYRLKRPAIQEWEQLADLYAYVGAPLRAASVLERAYGSAPGGKQAVRLAELYASSGRTDQAVKILDRAAASESVLLAKARILFRAREVPAAVQALEACLKHSPDNAEAHFYRGLCAWEVKDWGLARREFLRVSGNRELQARASAALAALNDLEQARQDSEDQSP